MVGDFRVIPTIYRSIKFRSRTEAKWAVFFDALGIVWEYEPEGYTDGSTSYLPDFLLTNFDVFWEIKGTEQYDEEKIEMLVRGTSKSVVIAIGAPQSPLYGGNTLITASELTLFSGSRIHWATNDLVLAECQIHPDSGVQLFSCRFTGIEQDCTCDPVFQRSHFNVSGPQLTHAYDKVTSHRFWDPAPSPSQPIIVRRGGKETSL